MVAQRERRFPQRDRHFSARSFDLVSHCARPTKSSDSTSLSRGVAEAALYCAHRAIYMFPPSLLVLSLGMGADGSSTARVQRGPSEAARCASTEDHQAPSPPLFCEQEGHLAAPYSLLPALPFLSSEGGLFGLPLRASNEGLLRPRVARAQETNRLPSFLSIRRTSSPPP